MDTIFALSSGKGKAGVSIIRISGDKAKDVLAIFAVKNIIPRVANLRKLVNPNSNLVIDHAVVISFDNPGSFTGEDVVEFHVHGSIAIISEILEILGEQEGFRLAEAGEFSKRSFENGKMDLLQAEGLADLIDSETLAQKSQAIRQMEGEFSNIYEDWRVRVIEIMAFIEAYVDFPDEEIPSGLDLQGQRKVEDLVSEMSSQLNNNHAERVRDGVNIVIVGKPNAGKSTLINFLTKRDLAIVSDIAGTTRDSLEAHFEISGLPITLIDTAGIRETEDVIEKEGVARALAKAENSDFKILIIDASDLLESDSRQEMLADNRNLLDENTLVILNKYDLISDSVDYGFLKENCFKVVEASLKNGAGGEEILKILADVAQKFSDKSEAGIVTRVRHRNLLSESILQLNNFIESRQNDLPIEISAENLRLASHAIGKIIGKIDVEDVLDKIFSEFCIGK